MGFRLRASQTLLPHPNPHSYCKTFILIYWRYVMTWNSLAVGIMTLGTWWLLLCLEAPCARESSLPRNRYGFVPLELFVKWPQIYYNDYWAVYRWLPRIIISIHLLSLPRNPAHLRFQLRLRCNALNNRHGEQDKPQALPMRSTSFYNCRILGGSTDNQSAGAFSERPCCCKAQLVPDIPHACPLQEVEI